jgi:hypothetical protein
MEMAEKEMETAEKKTKRGVNTGKVAPIGVKRGQGRHRGLPLQTVGVLAKQAGLQPWEIAGLVRYAKWPEGKQVTNDQFQAALNGFQKRPMGGGMAA